MLHSSMEVIVIAQGGESGSGDTLIFIIIKFYLSWMTDMIGQKLRLCDMPNVHLTYLVLGSQASNDDQTLVNPTTFSTARCKSSVLKQNSGSRAIGR